MPIEHARACLELEAEAIRALIPRINEQFTIAMGMIINCSGRVVVSGMGKSGIIGKKIAATLASTGTPAFFFIRPKAFMATWGWLPLMILSWLFPTAVRPMK